MLGEGRANFQKSELFERQLDANINVWDNGNRVKARSIYKEIAWVNVLSWTKAKMRQARNMSSEIETSRRMGHNNVLPGIL
jgi:hypothetical protein